MGPIDSTAADQSLVQEVFAATASSTMAADFSFGHDQVTGAALSAIGVLYAIGYFSSDPTKNLTKANLADLLAHGRHVGMVYEDTAQWMLGGAPAGKAAGVRAAQQAAAIGFDIGHCTVLTAADFDITTSAQQTEVLACLDAFHAYAPVVGFYGDQQGMQQVNGVSACQWQTDALSWSQGKVSPLADVVQRFNDPRAHGLPIDISDVIRPPLHFMGETPTPKPHPVGPAQILSPGALKPGQNLVSPKGTHFFAIQTDGNCVVYNLLSGAALWSSHTNGKGTTVFNIQADGNCVAYRGTTALWNSGTDKAGQVWLSMQDDGNLVLRKQHTNEAVWATGTAGR